MVMLRIILLVILFPGICLADFSDFEDIGVPESDDVLVVEDVSEDNETKKVTIGNLPGTGGAVSSVFGRTGTITAQPNDYNADQVDDSTTTNKFITQAEKDKLANIESNATADQTGAEIKIVYESEADTNAFTDTDHAKLDGIEAGATANSPDATLLNRANHTGTQAASTISDFTTAVQNMDLVENDVISVNWDGDVDSSPSENVLHDYLVLFDSDLDGDLTDEGWFPSTSGAPTNASYLTTSAEAGLSNETVITDSGSLAAVITDETGTGVIVFNINPNLQGQISFIGTTVDDDDCTGDQGKMWWDSVDSQFKICNADSGSPIAIGSGGGITAGDNVNWTGTHEFSITPTSTVDSPYGASWETSYGFALERNVYYIVEQKYQQGDDAIFGLLEAASGNFNVAADGAVSAKSFTSQATADPAYGQYDSDGEGTNKFSGGLNSNLTNTVDGAEDSEVKIKARRDGSIIDAVIINGDEESTHIQGKLHARRQHVEVTGNASITGKDNKSTGFEFTTTGIITLDDVATVGPGAIISGRIVGSAVTGTIRPDAADIIVFESTALTAGTGVVSSVQHGMIVLESSNDVDGLGNAGWVEFGNRDFASE